MKTLAYPLLWLLSHIYQLAAELNRLSFTLGVRNRHTLPGKTWSIGNLAVGGTGKSPVTVALAKLLLESGARPVILTRGYGVRINKGESLVLKAGDIVRPAGIEARMPDEARMQSAMLPEVPVVVAPDRWRAAQDLLTAYPEFKPTHWLLDDGFQHWPLQRDLDLVLLDASDPISPLMPLGRAREHGRALARADIVLFTRSTKDMPSSDMISRVAAHVRPGVPLIKSTMITDYPSQSCQSGVTFTADKHTPVCLVCGIAQPQQLQDAVSNMGITVGSRLAVSDHQLIKSADLQQACIGQKAVLTTAKDYWRDPQLFHKLSLPVFILPLRVDWDSEQLLRALHPYF